MDLVAALHTFLMTMDGHLKGTGRTTKMIESLEDGDRVIFATHNELCRVSRQMEILGKNVECLLVPVNHLSKFNGMRPPEGKTVLCHRWVDAFLHHSLDEAQGVMDLITGTRPKNQPAVNFERHPGFSSQDETPEFFDSDKE